MKITILKTEDKYLYKIDGYFNPEYYLMNGKELENTFARDWFVCNEYPNLLQKKVKVKINERWELKNKDLYNETIPLVVDEHSKEKYKNLVESDLYNYTFEEKETFENQELEVKEYNEIKDNIPFDYKVNLTSDGWCRETTKRYLINNIEFSIKDNCLVPSPIKQLTKPCVLDRKFLYEILVDYVKRNINKNYATVDRDYRFCFRVCCANEKKDTLIYWENDYDKRFTFEHLPANNFKELVKKIEAMKKEIIEWVNKEHICPACCGTGRIDKELDIKKYFLD